MKQTCADQNEQSGEVQTASVHQTAANPNRVALLLSGHAVCRRATHLSGVWLEPCEIAI